MLLSESRSVTRGLRGVARGRGAVNYYGPGAAMYLMAPLLGCWTLSYLSARAVDRIHPDPPPSPTARPRQVKHGSLIPGIQGGTVKSLIRLPAKVPGKHAQSITL